MSQKIGVIGGSGVYSLESIEFVQDHVVDTPYGRPSSDVKEFNIDGHQFFFLARHGDGHTISPSEINYRANIYALKKLGVEYLISVSAVGSLKEECPPTSFVLPDQFVDWTKGLRKRSFFENGVVGHVSVANPVDKKLQNILADACEQSQVEFQKNGSYICIEGPQFSSRAESEIYRSFGCTVIGMTNVPEAYLAKEAGMAYATLAMVTDYDCWKEEHCTLEEILKVMSTNYKSAQNVLKIAIPYLAQNKYKIEKENHYAVVTNIEKVAHSDREIIEVLKQ